MVEVKPIDKVVAKWQSRVSIAVDDYVENAVASASKWKANTEKSADVWVKAIQEALNRWKEAIAKTTPDKYAKAIETKGRTRYADGVRLAVDEYRAKMAKVLEVLKGITLPPRGPRGSPQNYERVKVVGDALHKAKLAGMFR